METGEHELNPVVQIYYFCVFKVYFWEIKKNIYIPYIHAMIHVHFPRFYSFKYMEKNCDPDKNPVNLGPGQG